MRDLKSLREEKERWIKVNRMMTNWAIPKAKKYIKETIAKLDKQEKECEKPNEKM